MTIAESIILAASLCADCLAVSLCSSTTLRCVRWKSVGIIALTFSIIQAGLLLAGWMFGYALAGVVERAAHIIGCVLLLYVGGGMLWEGIKNSGECRNLQGFKNVVIGGVATSIDALAVGVAMSIKRVGTLAEEFNGFLPLLISVFAITALSVIVGIYCGKAIGSRFGRWAEMVGGSVLIGIGISVLF